MLVDNPPIHLTLAHMLKHFSLFQPERLTKPTFAPHLHNHTPIKYFSYFCYNTAQSLQILHSPPSPLYSRFSDNVTESKICEN